MGTRALNVSWGFAGDHDAGHEVWFIQEICSKKRRITVELSKMSMPISNSGFSRTGSMIETQRSW